MRMRGAILAVTICSICLGVQNARAGVGDIYVTGDESGDESGLYRVDPVTGAQTRVIANVDSNNGVAIDATGAPLMVNAFAREIWRYDPASQTYTRFQVQSGFQPQEIAADQTGQYFVEGVVSGNQHSALDVIDPVQGTQHITALIHGFAVVARTADERTLLAGDNLYFLTDAGASVLASPGALPGGVAVGPDGTVYGATSDAVVRIDLDTGARTVVSTGGFFEQPVALAVGPQGNIDVVDHMYLGGSIIRVNPQDGSQTVLSSGGILNGTFVGAIAVVVPEPACWAPCLSALAFLLTRRRLA
jgi:sugar lactone lactonase YvrE